MDIFAPPCKAVRQAMTHDIDIRRNRLRYRTSHTGIKETDILFGGFVAEHGGSLGEDELSQAEDLLDGAHDPQILDWIIGRDPVPAAFDTPLMARLQAYVTERHQS